MVFWMTEKRARQACVDFCLRPDGQTIERACLAFNKSLRKGGMEVPRLHTELSCFSLRLRQA